MHSLAIFIHFTYKENKYFQSGESLVYVKSLSIRNLVVKPKCSLYANMRVVFTSIKTIQKNKHYL